MATPIHRQNDSRNCGAKTIVKGQSTVYVNGKLASVLGDPNTHGKGQLKATVNDGTVFINGLKVVLKGSDAAPDGKCPVAPHCNPKSVGASPNVFACGGPAGSGGGAPAQSDGPDPTREELYGVAGESNTQGEQTGAGGQGGTGPSGDPAAGGRREDLAGQNSDPNSPTGNVPADTNATRNVVPPESLANDADFQRELAAVKERYPGLTDDQIYKVIQGESSYNSRAVNPNSGATGFFQFTPTTANELGYTTAQIQNMTPGQQMRVYGEYLDRWNYNPQNELGIMQAAPAYADSRNGSDIVYKQGSAAWRQNKGWRDANGNITVDSINAYYRNQS